MNASSNNNDESQQFPSNSSTVVKGFFHPEVEMVKKLKFFIPQSEKIYERNKSMYNPNISKDEAAISSILFLKNKNLENKKKSSTLKYSNKWENINYENSLESKRKVLDEKIRDLKFEIKNYFRTLSEIKKEKEDMEFSRDILENFAKYSHEEEKLMKTMSIVGKRMDKLTEMEFEQLSNFKKLLDAKNNKRCDDVKIIKSQLIEKKEIIIKIKEEIQNKHMILKNLNKEIDKIKFTLLDHYNKLLKEGKDTRKEGLVWIIKAIWNLGYKVSPEFIPNNLDEQLISYLFNYSLIDIESRKLKKKIDEAHLKMKIKQDNLTGNFFRTNITNENTNNDIEKSSFYKTRSIAMKTQLGFNINRTNSFFDSSIINTLVNKMKNEDNYGDKNYSLKNIQELMDIPREIIDKESIDFVNQIKEDEKILSNIQNYLTESKKSELIRISFEFSKRDYKRRFNTTFEEIVSIIVGEDNTSNEITKIKREQKKLNELINISKNNNLSEGMNKKLNMSVYN